MIYFDNSATTVPYPEVVKVVGEVMEKYFANPSSLHYKGGEAEKLLAKTRQVVAEQLGVKAGEIVLTSGGSESNNTAIKGVAWQYRNRGKHLITSQVEHASVYEAVKQLEELGYEVTYLPVDRWGRVSAADVGKALREDTILVSIMHVNSELGTIQPLEEIGRLLKERPKVLFHVDAVQSFGKIPLDIRGWGIDLLSLSAHKFHGPRGAGILFVREGVKLFPLIAGGGQEGGMRAGTENLPGFVGLAKAMRMNMDTFPERVSRLRRLRDRLLRGLREIPGCVVNTPESEALAAPHIVNVSFPGLKAEVLLHALEEKGILVSTKSACSSKLDRPSRVLAATGMAEERAKSALRISFSAENTESEVDVFLRELAALLPSLKSVMRG
ncbi:cysteine desulfurase family protein [Bacillaceae bacterium]